MVRQTLQQTAPVTRHLMMVIQAEIEVPRKARDDAVRYQGRDLRLLVLVVQEL
jgi:hypothetical protein